jgi:Ca2+-binding EF-hand superfamily protein
VKKSLLLAALLCLPCEWGRAGDEPIDHTDIVYLGESRPMRLRLHISVEGKSPSALFEDYLRELFAFFDRDGDQRLDRDEAGRVLKAQALGTSLLQGQAAKLEDMDADEDGKATAEEFVRYYRRSGLSALRIVSAPGRGAQADVLAEALYRTLDPNRDGKLSREEASQAPTLLGALDQNEDELVTMQELLPAGANPSAARGSVASLPAPAPNRVGEPEGSPFVIISGDYPTPRLTQRVKLGRQLLDRYDQDKDQRLRRAEIVMEKAPFRRLDTNKDGDLDAMELVPFVNLPPELEVTLKFGKLGSKEMAAALTDPAKAAELARTVRRPDASGKLVSLEGANLDIRSVEPNLSVPATVRPALLQQLKAADAKGKGFVEAADLGVPQYRFLKNVFPGADRDGDGKLTEKEWLAWYDLHERARFHVLTLTLTDDGRDLFGLFDANRDGRLGLREVRSMWSRLAPLDAEKTEAVARAALPRQFVLTVGPGTQANVNRGVSVNPAGGMPTGTAAASGRGPVWFRKMDRNGDGDVSRKEWLGTPAQFSKLDTDGDGLVGVEEAEVVDSKTR